MDVPFPYGWSDSGLRGSARGLRATLRVLLPLKGQRGVLRESKDGFSKTRVILVWMVTCLEMGREGKGGKGNKWGSRRKTGRSVNNGGKIIA